MSRTVIGGAAALAIVVLTLAAYLLTTSRLETRIKRDALVRVAKAQELLVQNSKLEALQRMQRADELSSQVVEAFPAAIDGAPSGEPDHKKAEAGFVTFREALPKDEPRPDIMSVVDRKGRVIALRSKNQVIANPVPDSYFDGEHLRYRALELALGPTRQTTSEVWTYINEGPMKVAVAPVSNEFNRLVGAVVIGYSMTSAEAERQKRLLGADVVYFHDGKLASSSFSTATTAGDNEAVKKPLIDGGLAKAALEADSGLADLREIEVDGETYVATAGRFARFSSLGAFPDGYPPVSTGAMVAISLDDALAPVGSIRAALLVLGIGAILILLAAIYLTARRILGPVDQIETGVAEIINGNTDYHFEPVGSDLDGLSNSLNVLLARLLGRPEPGEEEYDDDGELKKSNQIELSPSEVASAAKQEEALRLAREPEDAYYARLFGEYVAALEKSGADTSDLQEDGFVNQLRLNEVTLREKYQARAVRFKVETDGDKVSLKPVPIK